MHLDMGTAVKRLCDCKPGELVYISTGISSGWSIALEDDGKAWAMIGFLAPSNDLQGRPGTMVLNRTAEVLSLGTDWVFRAVVGPESYSKNHAYLERPGSLHQDEKSLLLCFATDKGCLHYDLRDATLGGYPENDAIPFVEWQVWRNQRDVELGNAPLVHFELQLKPAVEV